MFKVGDRVRIKGVSSWNEYTGYIEIIQPLPNRWNQDIYICKMDVTGESYTGIPFYLENLEPEDLFRHLIKQAVENG